GVTGRLHRQYVEAAFRQSEAKRLWREMRAVPRQVEMEPGAAEAPPLPRVEVRAAGNGEAPTTQRRKAAPEIRHRIGDVLERVAHHDRVERPVREVGGVQRALPRFDALDARDRAGLG